MVEYNIGLPVALVEYKRHTATQVDLRHATYRALTALADIAQLPFILAFYWPEDWTFYVVPANVLASAIYKDGMALSERRFVRSLYYMRHLKIQKEVFFGLNATEPGDHVKPPRIIRPDDAT